MLIRKKNNNVEDIEYEIKEWKQQGKKIIETNLFPGENDYLVEHGHHIKPILFEIKDKQFLTNLENCPNFLKFKTSRNNKRYYRLKKRDLDLLDNHNIKYQPKGYIIYL